MSEPVNSRVYDTLEKPEGFPRERDVRRAAFLAWCPQLNGKRVGVYGTGANARFVLEQAKTGFSVVALIDDRAAGTTVHGYEVADTPAALERELDAIVIAAETPYSFIVRRRIKRLCAQHGVDVYDMYGHDLAELESRANNVMNTTFAERLAVIEQADVLCINARMLFEEGGEEPIVANMREGGDVANCLWPIVDYALSCGKTVAFCSSKSFITSAKVAEALRSRKLEGSCTVLLTEEVDLWVRSGLYRLLYDAFPGKRVVHIGPDVLDDCLIPLSNGKDVVLAGRPYAPGDFYEPIAYERAAQSWNDWFADGHAYNAGPAEQRLASCAEEVAPDLISQVGEAAASAACVVAPLAIGYATWLANKLACAERPYDAVLFGARDGYLVKQVYDMLAEHLETDLPQSVYFYTSRRASAAAGRDDEVGVLQRAGEQAYFAEQGLKLGGSYAFVEFVGAGTCQLQLERFVPFSLTGFYFGSRVGDILERMVHSCSYFDENDASFYMRYLMLEPYLSSDEPSLAGFASNGAPVFAKELRSASELEFLRAVQKGVLLFARAYFERWYKLGDVIDHEFVNSIMPCLDACDSEALSLYDDLSGRKLTKSVEEDLSGVPRPGELTPTQRSLITLLEAFDSLCEDFGLLYVATHGTLLGAVRHGGFVPNDDDLDVAMPRKDYDRFVELVELGALPDCFTLETPENTPDRFYGGYAKLRFVAQDCAKLEAPGSAQAGVWMDILPLDDCSLDDAAVERRQREVRTWQRLLYVKTYDFDMSHLWDVDPKKMSAYVILAEHLSREFLCSRLKSACTASGRTGLLTVFAGNYRWKRNTVRVAMGDILNAVRMPFATTTVPVAGSADLWLARYYGEDWRDVRPDETHNA